MILLVNSCCTLFLRANKHWLICSICVCVNQHSFSVVIIWNCRLVIRKLFAESELIMLWGRSSKLKCWINSDEYGFVWTLWVCFIPRNEHSNCPHWPSRLWIQMTIGQTGGPKFKDPCRPAIVTVGRDVTAQAHHFFFSWSGDSFI